MVHQRRLLKPQDPRRGENLRGSCGLTAGLELGEVVRAQLKKETAVPLIGILSDPGRHVQGLFIQGIDIGAKERGLFQLMDLAWIRGGRAR